VREGHDIASAATQRVTRRHRVLQMMTHLDPVSAPAAPLGHGEGGRTMQIG
jgi:hypothetical protein